jgi:2-keto-4-pentenoate hydratase
VNAIATALRAASQSRSKLAPLDPAIAPKTQEEGYAAQFAMAQALGAVPPAGFKIGATAAGMQAYLGVAGPMAGFMPFIAANGRAYALGDFIAPGVECEIGFRLGREIAPGKLSRAEAEAAVAECFPAIEIVENRYTDFKAVGAPTLIADQVFHAAAVIGAPASVPLAALDALEGRISHDGAELGSGLGRALMGHPLDVLVWLAGSAAAEKFGGLRAGQVILCGSVTPPFWLDRPGTVTVDFGPLGAVSTTFQ